MQLRIEPTNGIPIYEQIVRQVKFAIANGALIVGEHVPSVREMASLAAVNPNTVSRAYRDLSTEGILASIRGLGLAVTPEAPQLCEKMRLDMIRQRLHSVIQEALQNSIDPDEIRQLVEKELEKSKPESS